MQVMVGSYYRACALLLRHSWQVAKNMTEVDVGYGRCEHTDSGRWFLDNHMAGVADTDVVAVFSFIFIPL